jgi:tRNA pseudouridine38-40 synthase
MHNIKIVLNYDGTSYLGWQNSIEDIVKKALEQLLSEKVTLQAASRTDRGVHAHNQVINFFTRTKPTARTFLRALNALLRKDIVALHLEVMHPNFHPTLDVTYKEYHYHVCSGPVQLPQNRHYSWHCPYTIDHKLMQITAQHLIGTHNFSAFTNKKINENYTSLIRSIDKLEVHALNEHRFRIEIGGKNFLYKMVRNIVGSLVYVGCGKISHQSIPKILKSEDRTQAGVTAPAHGLSLNRVKYSGEQS